MERSSAPVRRVTKTARTNARRRSQLSDAVRAELLVGDDAGIDDVGDTQTIAATGDGADGGGGGGGDDDPHGDGLGSFLRSAGRKVMFTAKRSVSKITTAAARAITAALPKVTSFSTKQRAYIRDYGPGRVTGIRVFRVPLDAILNVAIDMMSSGALTDMIAEKGYEALYHLGVVITVQPVDSSQLVYFVYEKNHVVNFASCPPDFPGAKRGMSDVQITSADLPDELTLLDLITRHQVEMGDNYWTYHLIVNNCQYFILYLLNSLGIIAPSVRDFVFQDATSIGAALGTEKVDALVALTNTANTMERVKRAFGFGINGPRPVRAMRDYDKMTVSERLRFATERYTIGETHIADIGPQSMWDNTNVPVPGFIREIMPTGIAVVRPDVDVFHSLLLIEHLGSLQTGVTADVWRSFADNPQPHDIV